MSPATRAGGTSRPVAGAVVVAGGVLVAGLLLVLLATVVAARTPRSWSARQSPPRSVTVTAGHRYDLGTRGGPSGTAGFDSHTAPDCTIADGSGAQTDLTVTTETSDKALHRIGTFVAPLSGSVQVDCSELGDVYVDDPDGGTDLAGLLRVLGTVLLAVGLPAMLAALRGRSEKHARTRRSPSLADSSPAP